MLCFNAPGRHSDRGRRSRSGALRVSSHFPSTGCTLLLSRTRGFWDWMYPVSGGDEAVSEAALGVIILWFCWLVGVVQKLMGWFVNV